MSDEEKPSKLPSLSEVFGITNQDSLGSLHNGLSSISPLNSQSNISLPGSLRGHADLTAFALEPEEDASSIRSTGSLERRGYSYPRSITSSSSGASTSSSRPSSLAPLAPPRSSSLRSKASRASRKLPVIQTSMQNIPEGPSLMSLAQQQTPRAAQPPMSAYDPMQSSAYRSGQIPYSPLPSSHSLGYPSPYRDHLESSLRNTEEEDVKPNIGLSMQSFGHVQRQREQQLPLFADPRYRDRMLSEHSLYPASTSTRSSDASSERSSFSSEITRSSMSSNPSSIYAFDIRGTYRRPSSSAHDRTTSSRSGYTESDISSLRSNSPPKSPYSDQQSPQFQGGSAYFDALPSGALSRRPSSPYTSQLQRFAITEDQPMSATDYPSISRGIPVEYRPPITASGSSYPIPSRDYQPTLQPESQQQMPQSQPLSSTVQPPPGFRPAAINPFQRQSQSSMSGKYLCEFCNKRFNRPSSLRIHMHSHSGEKPFPCELCGRAFSVNSNLRRHLRVHEKYAAMEDQGKSQPVGEDEEMDDGQYIGSDEE